MGIPKRSLGTRETKCSGSVRSAVRWRIFDHRTKCPHQLDRREGALLRHADWRGGSARARRGRSRRSPCGWRPRRKAPRRRARLRSAIWPWMNWILSLTVKRSSKMSRRSSFWLARASTFWKTASRSKSPTLSKGRLPSAPTSGLNAAAAAVDVLLPREALLQLEGGVLVLLVLDELAHQFPARIVLLGLVLGRTLVVRQDDAALDVDAAWRRRRDIRPPPRDRAS